MLQINNLKVMNSLSVFVSFNKFPLAPMGVLALGSAHAGPSAQPAINTSGYLLVYISAEKPSTFSKKPKNRPQGARGWGSELIFLPEFLLFLFRSPCKNLKPYDNPFCGFE